MCQPRAVSVMSSSPFSFAPPFAARLLPFEEVRRWTVSEGATIFAPVCWSAGVWLPSLTNDESLSCHGGVQRASRSCTHCNWHPNRCRFVESDGRLRVPIFLPGPARQSGQGGAGHLALSRQDVPPWRGQCPCRLARPALGRRARRPDRRHRRQLTAAPPHLGPEGRHRRMPAPRGEMHDRTLGPAPRSEKTGALSESEPAVCGRNPPHGASPMSRCPDTAVSNVSRHHRERATGIEPASSAW